MNVETPNFLKSLPRSVRPDPHIAGRYYVRSQTRPKEHTVVTELLQCDCESATIGKSRKDAIANGGCPTFRGMCRHLRLALLAEALLLRHVDANTGRSK